MKNLYWLYTKNKKSIKYILLLIIIGVVSSVLAVIQALSTKYILDGAVSKDYSTLKLWLILLVIILILNIIFKTLSSVLTTYASEKTRNSLQEFLYSHIINSSWLEASKHHSVDFLTKTTNDVSTITNFLCNNIPQLISLFTLLLSSFFTLMTISLPMAFFAITIFPILIFFSRYYGRKLKKFYIDLQEKECKYNSFLQESFSNLLIIKSFCLEASKESKLRDMQDDKLNLNIKKSFFSSISYSIISFSSMVGTFVVLLWGIFKITSGELLFGSITAMLQLFANIQSPIYTLSSLLPQFISSLAACERLRAIEDLPLEVNSRILQNNSKIITSLSFRDVSFNYVDNKAVLKKVNLQGNSGEIIGIVGPSGEGKTTLIRLLLGLISPNSGGIFINSFPLTKECRNLMSYVPQGNTLFSGTISENLRFGNPKASDDEIFSSLKASSAFNFVSEFKDGIKTFIGEKGVGLSEGQAQRLSISRALLRKTPILLLDEATSSLDIETELRVLNEIRSLDHKPICFIITHREGALGFCDKIFRIKNKRCEQL